MPARHPFISVWRMPGLDPKFDYATWSPHVTFWEMIDKLELLLLLARERHFGRAAEAAGISQPSLSAAVKSLEEQFGLTMVERGSRFRGFTPEGERVLDWARRLVGDARSMKQDIEAMKRGIGGHLRLGVIPTALPFITSITLPFHERYPAVQFTVTSLTSIAILAAMENLELDLGISYIDNEAVGRFQTLPLYEERYALLVAQHHPLATCDTVSWREAGTFELSSLSAQHHSTCDPLGCSNGWPDRRSGPGSCASG